MGRLGRPFDSVRQRLRSECALPLRVVDYSTIRTSASRVNTDSYATSCEMNDEINQLDSIIDGTATSGTTIDTLAHLGDGTITSETYNQPNIGYDLLGSTTL